MSITGSTPESSNHGFAGGDTPEPKRLNPINPAVHKRFRDEENDDLTPSPSLDDKRIHLQSSEDAIPSSDATSRVADETLLNPLKRFRDDDDDSAVDESSDKFHKSEDSTEEVRIILTPNEPTLTFIERLAEIANYPVNLEDIANMSLPVTDQHELELVCQNRTITKEILDGCVLENKYQRESLLARVLALDDPESVLVTHTKNGGATFSIPVKYGKQAVLYEIQMQQDPQTAKKTYFFVIHHPMMASDSHARKLFGSLKIIDDEGNQFAKTSVRIAIEKTDLTPKFFSSLVKTHANESMKKASFVIQKHLLDKGKATILKSEVEQSAQALFTKIRQESPLGIIEESITYIQGRLDAIKEIQEELVKKNAPKEMLEPLKAMQKAEVAHLNQKIQSLKTLYESTYTLELVDDNIEIKDAIKKCKSLLKITQAIEIPIYTYELANSGIDILRDTSIQPLQVVHSFSEGCRLGPEKNFTSTLTQNQIEFGTLQKIKLASNASCSRECENRVEELQEFADYAAPFASKKQKKSLEIQKPVEALQMAQFEELKDPIYEPQPRRPRLLSQVVSFCAQAAIGSLWVADAIIGTNFYRGKVPGVPLEDINDNSSSARLLVTLSFKKFLDSPLGKLRQSELHNKFDSTGFDLVWHKLNFAENFQQKYQNVVDDPEGLDRIVRHRELSMEVSQGSAKDFYERIGCLTDQYSPKVVHLANGGASISFPGGCKGHYVIYECKYEPHPVTGQKEFFFVVHNRGMGANDQELHGVVEIKTRAGVNYAKGSVTIQVKKEALTQELIAFLSDRQADASMKESYDYIKGHLLDAGGSNIVSSKEELEAIVLIQAKRNARKEISGYQETIVRELEQLKAIATLKSLGTEDDEKEFLDELEGHNVEQLLAELANIEEFLNKQDGFPLLSEAQKSMLKSSIRLNNYEQIIEVIEQILVQTTNCLLEDDLAKFKNTILETDESFSSDQTFGTCIESSRTGPERQMASSNTRRMLKLYTLQNLAQRVWQYQHIDVIDKRDMLHLAEVRKIQLLSKITLP